MKSHVEATIRDVPCLKNFLHGWGVNIVTILHAETLFIGCGLVCLAALPPKTTVKIRGRGLL